MTEFTGTQVQVQPHQVVFMQSTAGVTVDRLNYNKAGIPIAACQLIVGILCIALNIADLFAYLGYGWLFSGLWCGTVFIVTGSIGIGAGITRRKCLIIGFMVMSIISAVCTCAIFAQSSMQVILTSTPIDGNRPVWGNAKISKPLNITLLCLACVELMTAIASAVLCGRAVCDKNRSLTVGPVNMGPQHQCQSRTQPGIQANVTESSQGVAVCYPQLVAHTTQPYALMMNDGQQMTIIHQGIRGQSGPGSCNMPAPSYQEKR